VLVHAYLDVDHVEVAAATASAPQLFGEYVRQVARWLGDQADDL
jgi:uncharacterized protein YutE (UPF0331/DUF86 family)